MRHLKRKNYRNGVKPDYLAMHIKRLAINKRGETSTVPLSDKVQGEKRETVLPSEMENNPVKISGSSNQSFFKEVVAMEESLGKTQSVPFAVADTTSEAEEVSKLSGPGVPAG